MNGYVDLNWLAEGVAGAELDGGEMKKVWVAHGKHGERDRGDEAAFALIVCVLRVFKGCKLETTN